MFRETFSLHLSLQPIIETIKPFFSRLANSASAANERCCPVDELKKIFAKQTTKMLQKFHCEHVLEELGNCGYYQKLLIAGFLIPFAVLVALQSNTL